MAHKILSLEDVMPFGKHVGCHHKTKNPTRPLGVIPSEEIKHARKHLHALIDPLWESGIISRDEMYKKISDQLGYEYHTAEIRTIENAREIYRIAKSIKEQAQAQRMI